jgi:hypothetical protein
MGEETLKPSLGAQARALLLPILILLVIVAMAVLVVSAKLERALPLPFWPHDPHDIEFVLHLLSLFLPILVTIWFIDVFTGVARERMEQMIFYAYLFPFLFLGGLILFLAYADFSPMSKAGADTRQYMYPPIGIVRGCVSLPRDADTDAVPKSIRCENNSDQWMVNVGGQASQVVATVSGAGPALAELSAAPMDVPTASGVDPVSPNKVSAPLPSAIPAQAGDANASFAVQGGLVIPLYFIVLAVFGGAISIVRRVPEYQARFAQPEGSVDYLSPERVREALVFQIMQLFTAPLIAITAFYVANPASRAVSVGLAFLAGFSSETVLKYIRAAVEKVAPETSRDWPTAHLTPVNFDFGKQQIKVPGAECKATISNSGATSMDGMIVAPPEFQCAPVGAFSIAAGGHLIIGIMFSPETVGEKNADLKIVYNGRGSPLSLKLKGTGVE